MTKKKNTHLKNYENETNAQHLFWPHEDKLPPLYSNVFASFVGDNEVILLLGSFIPTGVQFQNENEREEYYKNPTVQPLAKIVMSRPSFEKFFEMLQQRMINIQENTEDKNE